MAKSNGTRGGRDHSRYLISWSRLSDWLQALRPSRLIDARGRTAADRLGVSGEVVAARFLRRQGYRILARSHRQRLGEIDLIAVDDGCIVFVEVKTWRTGQVGDPSEAVDRRKQEKLTRAALIYLKQKKLLDNPARFDVISIVWPETPKAEPEIRHFKHAFEAQGTGQLFS